MSTDLNDSVWITLMHELQSFVRENLERPEVAAELRYWITSPTPINGQKNRGGRTDVMRVFELLAPGLMVDFLSANREILNKYALRIWAAEREILDQQVNVSA